MRTHQRPASFQTVSARPEHLPSRLFYRVSPRFLPATHSASKRFLALRPTRVLIPMPYNTY